MAKQRELTKAELEKIEKEKENKDQIKYITSEDFEELKKKFSKSALEYYKKVEKDENNPRRINVTNGTTSGVLATNGSGTTQWVTNTNNTNSPWTTSIGGSGVLTTTAPSTYGTGNVYGSNSYGVTTISTTPYITWTDVNAGFITNSSPSIGERIFQLLSKVYNYKPTKKATFDKIIEQFIPTVQSYYYYQKMINEEKTKNPPPNQATFNSMYGTNTSSQAYAEAVLISQYKLIIECMVLDCALKAINEDTERIKAILDTRTSTIAIMRLIFDAFGDMLREMVDRFEGTGRTVEYSYYAWFVPYIQTGMNIMYGELSVQATEEK